MDTIAAELPLADRSQTAKRRRRRNARFEEGLAFQIRAHQLPEPHQQYRWATELLNENKRPRQFRADFFFAQFKLIVEVQGAIWQRGGGGHSHPTGILKDIDKLQCAALLGLTVLPVTTDEVKRGEAITIIERVLHARGWAR